MTLPIRVTMQDIATACGVGKATVSRALNGRSYVKPELVKKIKNKAKELGYLPDPALRALSQLRWTRPENVLATLAVIRVFSTRFNLSDVYLASLQHYAHLHGYNVEEFVVTDAASVKKTEKILLSRGIRGVIILPIIEPIEWRWNWKNFFFVGCGIGEYRLPIHCVDVNQFLTTRMCWRECLERGYERIGAALFRQPWSDENDALRHAALYYEQMNVPDTFAKIPIFEGTVHEFTRFEAWIQDYKPDVVIGLNSTAYWWIKRLNLRVPEDIGVCLLYGEAYVCSGAIPMHDKIAEVAIHRLDQLLLTNECGLPKNPDLQLLTPHWMHAYTLRPSPRDDSNSSQGEIPVDVLDTA